MGLQMDFRTPKKTLFSAHDSALRMTGVILGGVGHGLGPNGFSRQEFGRASGLFQESRVEAVKN